ncbi:hypothetical protein TUM17571_16730 [Klebsiella pneumoniae]|nr:hypothetical protein TUM17557_16730 [Enterobacter cloacae]GJL07365.1 hypothetical protein TUM17571_16730 [Klebsiella pneumoniae]
MDKRNSGSVSKDRFTVLVGVIGDGSVLSHAQAKAKVTMTTGRVAKNIQRQLNV